MSSSWKQRVQQPSSGFSRRVVSAFFVSYSDVKGWNRVQCLYHLSISHSSIYILKPHEGFPLSILQSLHLLDSEHAHSHLSDILSCWLALHTPAAVTHQVDSCQRSALRSGHWMFPGRRVMHQVLSLNPFVSVWGPCLISDQLRHQIWWLVDSLPLWPLWLESRILAAVSYTHLTLPTNREV